MIGAENIGMAIGAVWTHRFRSLLTILGIVIGITTVVTVASLLTGLRAGVVTFFQELGPDNIFAYKTSGDPSAARAPQKEVHRRAIRPEYADVIRRWAINLEGVGLQLFETDQLAVLGVSANLIELSPRELEDGRYFTAEEDARVAHVAVIGSSMAEALFPSGHALENTFMVDGAEFRVVASSPKPRAGSWAKTVWTTRSSSRSPASRRISAAGPTWRSM